MKCPECGEKAHLQSTEVNFYRFGYETPDGTKVVPGNLRTRYWHCSAGHNWIEFQRNPSSLVRQKSDRELAIEAAEKRACRSSAEGETAEARSA